MYQRSRGMRRVSRPCVPGMGTGTWCSAGGEITASPYHEREVLVDVNLLLLPVIVVAAAAVFGLFCGRRAASLSAGTNRGARFAVDLVGHAALEHAREGARLGARWGVS